MTVGICAVVDETALKMTVDRENRNGPVHLFEWNPSRPHASGAVGPNEAQRVGRGDSRPDHQREDRGPGPGWTLQDTVIARTDKTIEQVGESAGTATTRSQGVPRQCSFCMFLIPPFP